MVGTNTDTLKDVSYTTHEKCTNKEPIYITYDFMCLKMDPPNSGKL
jgi:hypothetical protein